MTPEEQDQLDLEKAQQARRAQEQGDRVVVESTPLPPDPAVAGGVRGALTLTENDNADNEVLINRLSILAAQPKAALRALDPAELQRMAREHGVLFGTEETPTLRKKFTDPDFARSASDDVKALADIEKEMLAARAKLSPPKPAPLLDDHGGLPSGLFPSKPMGFTDLKHERSGARIVNPVDLARAGAAGIAGDTLQAGGGIIQSGAELGDEMSPARSPSPALAALFGNPREAVRIARDLNARANGGTLPQNSDSILARAAEWGKSVARTGKDVGDYLAPEATGDVVLDSINSGVRSAGQSMVWVAAAAVTGQPELAIGGLTGVTYGQKYNEYREAGISPFESFLGAGAQAGLENLTEKLPFHILVGDITNKTPFGQMLLKQLFAENATEQVATFTQDMVDWAELNPDKTVGEFLAERPEAALQTAIATTVATMLQTTVATGADKAAGYLDKTRREEERAAAIAKGGREALKNLVTAAAESKARERDPEQFKDYIDKLAQDGPVKAAYFSPEAFARTAQTMGKTPDELAALFGVENQVEPALASGAKIEVPLGVFLEKVGGLANATAIIKDVSHSPFALSEVEEAAIPEAARQRILAEAENVATAANKDEEFAAGVETVRAHVEKQLNDAGRFVGTPNRLYAQLAAVFYGNLSRQLGITPEEAFVKHPLNVVGERITGGSTNPSDAFVSQGEAFDSEGNQIRGRVGGAAEARSTGFLALDANPNTTQAALAEQLGITVNQASAIRKAWKESRGVATNKGRALPKVDAAVFEYLDARRDTEASVSLSDIAAATGATLGQADTARKAWRAEHDAAHASGVENAAAGWEAIERIEARRKARSEKLGQEQFEPLDAIAVDDLLDLPEPLWNDHIKATKYAAYNLPKGIDEAALPKGYVVVQSSQGNYAVKEAHLKERMVTGEKFARMEQGGRGYYTPSTATIQLMAKADLSTFIHEIGHHFLEMRSAVATELEARLSAGETLTSGEQELLDDVNAWFEQAGVKPGASGEGSALAQELSWGLYFFDNILIDPTEAELKAFRIKQAIASKGPVVKLFKTTAGRIIAFPGNEYSHADARTLLAANDKPGAVLRMQHATWDGGSLKFQSWYDVTGTMADEGGKFAQLDVDSFKGLNESTPQERSEWFDSEVTEEVHRPFTGAKQTTLRLKSDPKLKHPDIDVKLNSVTSRDGHRGVTADLYFNGKVTRNPDEKPTPEDLRKAQQVFVRAILALQVYAERNRPDYISFVPSASRTSSRQKLYDAILRRYDFGYEARIFSTIDIVATPSETTRGVSKSFMLVRPDLAAEIPLELSNAQIRDTDWFGEPATEKRRVITEIARPGNPDRFNGSDNGGGTRGGPGNAGGTLAQGRARQAAPVDDRTIDRASKELNEKQFEAWKLATAGYGNEDIAVSMGGENAEVTPEQVKVWLYQARQYGYDSPKQPKGLAMSGQTLHVLSLSARGIGPTQIAETVYPDRDRDSAINQVKQLRFRHKALIEQWKAKREGKLGQGPVFYSALKRAAVNAKQAKAPAADWKAILKKAEGVKAEEIEWTGLFDWLDTQEGSVPREAVAAFLDANGVKVEEVKLSDKPDLAKIEALVEAKLRAYEDELLAAGSYEDSLHVSQQEDEDGNLIEAWDLRSDGVAINSDTYDSEEAAQEAADELNADMEADTIREELNSKRSEFEREAEDELADSEGTQWAAHTLPGGSDYTELLLTLPAVQGPSTHWDTPNVVAHARFKTRRGPNGERVLALEEIQSDWHQKGKERGYKASFDQAKLDEAQAKLDGVIAARAEARAALLAAQQEAGRTLMSEPFVSILKDTDAPKDGVQPIVGSYDVIADHMENTPGTLVGSLFEQALARVKITPAFRALPQEDRERFIAVSHALDAAETATGDAALREREAGIARDMARNPVGIPEAPFKDTKAWASLVLKRMVRYAAEHGFDQVAWIPGNVKNGDTVPDTKAKVVELRADGSFQYRDADGDWIKHNSYTAPNATLAPAGWRNVNGSDEGMTLNNVLGKEVADQLRKAAPDENGDRQLPGDFTIHNQPGWEFYDIIVPSAANALGKKYGASAQMGSGGVVLVGGAPVAFHVLPITPELKAAALEGLPLFQPEQDGTPPGGNPLSAEEKAFFARAMRELPPGSSALAVWNSMSFKEREPYHELWARQVEAYFFEGKAPTPKLKRMFDKFREWLVNVYQSLVNLNAPLTDEVRGIMDRMLASKQEIDAAHRTNALQPLFAVKPEHMTDQEWTSYQSTNAEATADAETNLTQRSLRDTKWLSNARSREMKRLQNEAREQRKAMGAEVATEVMSEKVNVARQFLSKGKNKDGAKVDDFIAVFGKDGALVSGKLKLSIAALKEMYPEDSGVDWAKLGYGKYGMLAEDGLRPDAIAGVLGYESGDALVRDLTTAEPASEKIEGLTDQRMLERYGDLTDEASIARAADEAVYSSLRGKVLAAEYAALSSALGERKLLNEAAQTAAETLVRRMNASKLNANKFLAAERRAGRAAEDALRKNDLAGAAAAKKDQLLNFHLARVVMAKQKEYDKANLKFKQIIDAKRDSVSKSRNFDLVQASRAVLAAYGKAQMKHKPMEYLGAVKRYDPTLYAALEPALLNAVTSRQHLTDLTVEQFFGVRDVVVQLWDLAREEKLVEINGQKVALKDVTDALNLHMEALGADPNKPIAQAPSPAQRTLRMLEGAAASLRRVEAWARMMDKGAAGPFTKFIWRPVSQAATRYRGDQTKYIMKFRELFAPIEKQLGNARIAATELGYTFANKAELLHAILHTGNESNKRKLLMGYRWAKERADGTLDTTRWDQFLARMVHEGTLTVQDYQFAQSVWDLLEETKPLAQETHRRVFGRYFAEITADVVHTPFGDFKGGYIPAIYDDYHNTDVALKRGQDAVEGNDSTMFPSPSKGFTEARVEYNRPMQLDVRLLASHLDKVLKFAHMAAPVRDVLRILRAPGVERHLHDLHATAIEDMLLPWLVRSARQTNEAPITGKAGRAVTAFANGLRRRSNMGLMFANIVNVLQQPTGLFNAAAFKGVKKRYIGQAMARFLRNPAGVHEAVRALSPLMETRGSAQAIAMRDTLDTIVAPKGPFEKAAAWFERHTYFAQTALQNQQDVVVWLGAYESAKSRGETEYEAAQFADGVVRQTQGSATPEDISRFETGTGWQKILTSMYGFFNMWGNHLSTEFRDALRDQGFKTNKGRLLYVYFVGFAVPALLAQAIADGIRGDLPDDEDEGLAEWLAWIFGTQARTATAMVPIVGASVQAGINAFNDKPYDDRVLSSPAVSALETLVRTPKDFVDYIGGEGDLSRTTKDSMAMLTLLTGLPFQALARPLGYLADVVEGDTEPKDAVDFARGLVAGR